MEILVALWALSKLAGVLCMVGVLAYAALKD